MHSDEANQAVKAGELLETGDYAFDPRDHHGPTLYYAALPIAWLRGERTLAVLDETTVRLVPALAGTIGVLLLVALAAPLGRWPALVAGAFMAVSPPAVYYSRYFIQETLLVTFTLAALVCAQQWRRTGRVAWAMGAGVGGGLMLATKELAPLFALAAAIAAFVLSASTGSEVGRDRWARRESPDADADQTARPAVAPYLSRLRSFRDLAVAAGTALVVALLFYSSFGTHIAGMGDAVMAYGQAWSRSTGESGHEKSWWYYLRLFGWQRSGGVVFEQVAFSIFLMAGFATAIFSANKFLRWTAFYTVIIVVALSLAPYKTPWHAVHFVPGFAVLAAGALAGLPNWRWALALAGVTLAFQTTQTWRVAFAYAADARNPYAYVHSSPDVLKFRALAEAALARAPAEVIRVIGGEYWPLPWYLRGLPQVGYWSAPPAACDGALVIVSAGQAEAVRVKLRGAYRESILGLRPGVLCVVFTPLP